MLVNNEADQLLVVVFARALAKYCKDELGPFCRLEFIECMDELENINGSTATVLYLMDYTSSTHIHNIEYIRNKFSDNLFYVVTTSLSIPLLHHSIHIGVNDLYLFPLSETDRNYIVTSSRKTNEQEADKTNSNVPWVINSRNTAPIVKENPIWSLLNSIERDFANGPSLQDLSNDIHLSPSRLCHMFKDVCGITYSNYLICRKLEESERLLTLDANSITTISYQLGFSNPSHFCRSFKEHYNITPNSFAQGNRDLDQSLIYKRYQRLRTEILPNMLAEKKQTKAVVKNRKHGVLTGS